MTTSSEGLTKANSFELAHQTVLHAPCQIRLLHLHQGHLTAHLRVCSGARASTISVALLGIICSGIVKDAIIRTARAVAGRGHGDSRIEAVVVNGTERGWPDGRMVDGWRDGRQV